MARTPQKPTLKAPFHNGAPPAFAAMPPSNAKNSNESTATAAMMFPLSVTMATSKGKAAPIENVAAEVNAA